MASKSNLLSLALILTAVFASAHRPLVVVKHGEENGKMKIDEQKNGDMGHEQVKLDDVGDGNLKQGAIKPMSMAIGLVPTVPGGDGGFHFNLGPIGFGGSWDWGAFPPGYVAPYSQPYVVVSPYMSPYATPSPYPYTTPYQQPGTGYGPPFPSYSGPYASPGDYAPGSHQMRSSEHN